jgi:hypothetical protein
MNTIAHTPDTPPTTRASHLIERAWQINRGLSALGVLSLGLIAFSTLGLLLDPRTTAFLGTPTWAKTFKFSVSMALYSAGLLWAITLTAGRTRRMASISGELIGWILSAELVLVVIQGMRAQPMHFNYSTPLDAALWITMTVGIGVMFVAFIVLVVAVWRGLQTNPVLAWAVRLGLIVTALGLAQGNLMPGPTPAQMQAIEAGQAVRIIGAHTVGSGSLTPDNGPGLPLLGWSTTHGDLRVGHFVGLHALQLIPLLGLFLARRREPWLSNTHRVGLVWVGALGYLGLVVLVTWQALRGQPLIAPDALTITALAGIMVFVLTSSITILTHARMTART